MSRSCSLTIEIREVLPEDQDAFRQVHARAFQPLRAIYKPGPKARSGEQNGKTTRLVAIRNGQIQATACYEITDDFLEIFGFATDPEHQSQGLARAILQAMEGIAQNAGKKQIRASVVTETGNVAIYQRLGFSELATKESQTFISDQFAVIHETVMEKMLF